ncbi:MAG TPA: caspase family protein [Thermoanaerobaculia bacterium]|nr:caspase family protein [Thermoanaerobaculia bacterium]
MRFATLAFIALIACSATAQPARRALLIGIDDYTASTLPIAGPQQHRGWPDLQGAANDVRILSEMLVLRYGFDRKDIVTLTNQQATRAAILHSIEQHLVRPAQKGDVVFYYFAGHGAQVPNTASDEPDLLDESIVPADSRRGAADIRDKELRPFFNQVLDRGAHLTLLLDHCHSGGAFRGLPNGTRPRGIAHAPPIDDRRDYGQRPDERGALILVSTQDLDSAWETRGDDGRMHGAFTWAWIQAMRDAVAGEPAQETFLRAQARLRGETPYQSPAMLGRSDARLRPFLGLRPRSRDERMVVAVERVEPNGDVILQGGWAHGLAVGSELSPVGNRRSRLRITRLLGLGRGVARMSAPFSTNIRSGTLLEVVSGTTPQGRPLRVWLGRDAPVAGVDGITFVGDPRDADYRLERNSGEYSWVRAGSEPRGLPRRTAWTDDPMQLRRDLVTLRRIHSWLSLASPAAMAAPYHLAVRDEKTHQLVRDTEIIGDRIYSIVLRASEPPGAELMRRHYYVFVVDSHGNSRLVFPRTGSIENRFPIGASAPAEIALGAPSAFRITRPYGIDTYFLLSTEEPLPNPSILEWDGVRARRALTDTRWSIERITLESIAPARRRVPAARSAPRRR